MLDHVDDMIETTIEIARILKPGGQLVLQCYYNSFPLLKSEPGVFDNNFLSTVFLKIFEPLEFNTFALGDPQISASYNCDIIVGRFKARENYGDAFQRLPRDRYLDPQYMGIQSLISTAIDAVDTNDIAHAEKCINNILDANRPTYELHAQLLTMALHIMKGEFGDANKIKKALHQSQTYRLNRSFALTLERLENRRIVQANTKNSA